MSVSEPGCWQDGSEGLIILGPLNATMLYPSIVGFGVDGWINCPASVWSWKCVRPMEHIELERRRMLMVPAVDRGGASRDPASARLPAVSAWHLGFLTNSTWRCPLSAVQSDTLYNGISGEAFDLNCKPTAASIPVSTLVYCSLLSRWLSRCKTLLSEHFFNHKCALLNRKIHRCIVSKLTLVIMMKIVL